MARNYYDTDRAASEYLFLHYGGEEPTFPARCVAECPPFRATRQPLRGLDLGCAVGRSTFELARECSEVIGIDFSKQFISIANRLKKKSSLDYHVVTEGELTNARRAAVPKGIDRERVHFEWGDAMNLRRDLGVFDVVLMANLIDRLSDPRRCLAQLPQLLTSGGQLIITSPYTWLPEYTPRKNWLGGFVRAGKTVKTLATLKKILSPDFRFSSQRDLPFLIREHARKFQFGMAEATVWVRR